MPDGAPAQDASFRVRTVAFPAGDWYEFRKAFKPRRSDRVKRTPDGPPWERIDGRGFTLWISDACLADSRTVPPIWEIRLQSIAPLNQAGQERWQEVCEGIDRFIRGAGLVRVHDSPPEGSSRGNVVAGQAAEPGAAADRGLGSDS